MQIKLITWKQALPIRHQVLWPNKAPEFSKVKNDETATHYGVFIEDELVSVASIFIENEQAQLRKFATLESYQGQGIGSYLISHVIAEMKALQLTHFWCDARKGSADFYCKFNMQIQGNAFLKYGEPYYQMRVALY